MKRHWLLKHLRLAVFIAIGTTMPGSLAVAAEQLRQEPQARFIIVLERLASGQEPFDVTKHGGRVDHRSGTRVAVTMPESALEGVRRNPRVRYVQRLVTGLPGRSSRPTNNGAAASAPAVRERPRFETATDGTNTLTLGPYSYDDSGNITAIGRGTAGTGDAFEYDRAGRLSAAAVHDGIGARNESYVYDSTGNLTQFTTQRRTAGSVETVTIPLAVDAATNRLADVTYDDAGNVTSVPASGELYFWDALGMPARTLRGAYAYTADDERILVIHQVGLTQRWSWTLRDLAARPIREYESFGPVTAQDYLWVTDHFYADTGVVASQREAAEGGQRHFHLDHLGTPRLVTNAGGERLSEHTYFPFGPEATSLLQERVRGFEHEEPLRFTGHERDNLETTATEDAPYVDYMHARYYSPKWGRFLSVDPTWESADLGAPQSWNRYSYVRNNPIGNTDPDGRICTPCAAVGALVAVGYESYRQVRSGEPVNNGRLFAAAGIGAGAGAALGQAPAALTALAGRFPMAYLTAMEVGVAATGAGVVGGRSVSLDTNAVIAAVEGGAAGAAAVAAAMGGKAPVVSATVVAEFAKKGNMAALADFLKSTGGTVVKGVSSELVKSFEARGLKPADAEAVAAAVASGTKFLTRDKDILKKVPDVATSF